MENLNNVQKNAKQAFNGAAKAADQIGGEIKNDVRAGYDQARDKLSNSESSLTERYEAFRDSASEGYDTAVETVKKYPLYAVLGATGIGLLAGLLIARRRS